MAANIRRPILAKMSIHIELAATTCILFVFGLEMFIIEENRCECIAFS